MEADSTVTPIVTETAGFVVEHYSPPPEDGIDDIFLTTMDGFGAECRDGDSFRLNLADGSHEDLFVYRRHFHGMEHKNMIGTHPTLGPVVISIRRDKQKSKSVYRAILRMQDSYRHLVVSEDDLYTSSKMRLKNFRSVKETLSLMFPDLQTETLSLKEVKDEKLAKELLRYEEKVTDINYKFGVIYAKPGQTTEEEMLSNENGSESFTRFLNCIGTRVNLRGFKGYKGGLDVTNDTHGKESYVSLFQDFNIMLHVSTFLPYTPNNPQQVQRKAQIGNDICVIVFKDSGAGQVAVKSDFFVSHFPHVFIFVEEAVSATDSFDGNPKYRIACARKEDVAIFDPAPSGKAYFDCDSVLKNFILAKLINGEHAAYGGRKFSSLRQRTRKSLLDDIVGTFLKKSSFGSLTSLSSWKSFFGSASNNSLNDKQSPRKDRNDMAKTRHEPLSGTNSLSGSRSAINQPTHVPVEKPRELERLKDQPLSASRQALVSLPKLNSDITGSRSEITSSSNALDDPFKRRPTVKMEDASRRVSGPKIPSSPLRQSPAPSISGSSPLLQQLRDENVMLRRKLEQKSTELVNNLKLQENEQLLRVYKFNVSYIHYTSNTIYFTAYRLNWLKRKLSYIRLCRYWRRFRKTGDYRFPILTVEIKCAQSLNSRQYSYK